MLFYDFEVFEYNWLMVAIDMKRKQKHVISDKDTLLSFYKKHLCDIWVGFNSTRYDKYILQGILCDFNPKEINDFIITGNDGYKFSKLLNKFPFYNYDVKLNLDKGLKWFEGSMGHDIKETSVPFNINRKLTDAELAETIKYCTHDVEQTIVLFLKRKSEFEGKLGLIKMLDNDLGLLSKTNPQLTALILKATKILRNDEFNIDFPSTLKISKYQNVIDWYKNPENKDYKKELNALVAGVPHTFAWGGLHGAIKKYHGVGRFINMDVASLYPTLMIKYNLHSRSISNPQKYADIYNERLRLKKIKDPLQKVLKIVLNSAYGVMKDKYNALYDPRQANRVCVYGQLLLLDLIEKLEPHCYIIQSNTDGVLVKADDVEVIKTITAEWEQRTHLSLEFDEYREVYQKDVNNYVLIDNEGNYKSKGGYVKKLSELDYGDFPIVNKAIVAYMINKTPIEQTILNCSSLKDFQMVVRITSKYKYIVHGNKRLQERCIRAFASNIESDEGVKKISARTGNAEKIANTPEHVFIYNDVVNNLPCPHKLNKDWYVLLAEKRLKDFL